MKMPAIVRTRTALLLAAVFSLLISGCGKDLEKETFDVYLIAKDGKEEKVDTVVGISECRKKAENLALYKNYIEYDYTCCLKTADSDCAEKHK